MAVAVLPAIYLHKGGRLHLKGVQEVFEKTEGLDPLFRPVDGANNPDSPHPDQLTLEERRDAYSMLLNKANIRVGIGIPDDAEFELTEIDDPYGLASATELSLFRRPMPSANLKFLSSVMWDGRETHVGSSFHGLYCWNYNIVFLLYLRIYLLKLMMLP